MTSRNSRMDRTKADAACHPSRLSRRPCAFWTVALLHRASCILTGRARRPIPRPSPRPARRHYNTARSPRSGAIRREQPLVKIWYAIKRLALGLALIALASAALLFSDRDRRTADAAAARVRQVAIVQHASTPGARRGREGDDRGPRGERVQRRGPHQPPHLQRTGRSRHRQRHRAAGDDGRVRSGAHVEHAIDAGRRQREPRRADAARVRPGGRSVQRGRGARRVPAAAAPAAHDRPRVLSPGGRGLRARPPRACPD